MREVRRDDGELCGFVTSSGGSWLALAVFGAVLGEHESEQAAHQHVRNGGLAALADRWTLVDGVSGAEQVVCIQHASPAEVSLAIGYYAHPGVETLTVSAEDMASGRWRLEYVTFSHDG